MAVRQQRPKTVDDAVRATLEVESYGAVAPTGTKYAASPVTTTVPEDPVTESLLFAVSRANRRTWGNSCRSLRIGWKNLTEGRERGSDYHRPWRSTSFTQRRGGGANAGGARVDRECWICGERGHISRGCPNRRKGQGNS